MCFVPFVQLGLVLTGSRLALGLDIQDKEMNQMRYKNKSLYLLASVQNLWGIKINYMINKVINVQIRVQIDELTCLIL